MGRRDDWAPWTAVHRRPSLYQGASCDTSGNCSSLANLGKQKKGKAANLHRMKKIKRFLARGTITSVKSRWGHLFFFASIQNVASAALWDSQIRLEPTKGSLTEPPEVAFNSRIAQLPSFSGEILYGRLTVEIAGNPMELACHNSFYNDCNLSRYSETKIKMRRYDEATK